MKGGKTLFGADPIELTVFIPCYNDQDGILGTIISVVEVCQGALPDSWEIIIIDDASTDLSPTFIRDFIYKNPELRIQLIENPINEGFSFNFVEAAFKGRGKYYLVIHAGNILPPTALVSILDSRDLADIVICLPVDRGNRTFFRWLLSRTFNVIANISTGYRIGYWNGAVLHKRYDVMRWHSNSRGHSFLLLLVFQCLEEGRTFTEIPIELLSRSKKRKAKSFTLPNFCSISHSLLTILAYRIRKRLFRK